MRLYYLTWDEEFVGIDKDSGGYPYKSPVPHLFTSEEEARNYKEKVGFYSWKLFRLFGHELK